MAHTPIALLLLLCRQACMECNAHIKACLHSQNMSQACWQPLRICVRACGPVCLHTKGVGHADSSARC